MLQGKSGTILYFGGFELPDRNAAAHRVLNNAKIITKMGYRVAFGGTDGTITEDACTPQIVSGFESYPKKRLSGAKKWLRETCSFRHMRYVLEQYADTRAVIAYNLHFAQLKRLMQYCRKRGIKVIADATEWVGDGFSLHPVSLAKWLDAALVMKHLHKKTDGVICISQYMMDFYSCRAKNTVLIPPLVDLSEDIWSQEPLRDADGTVQLVYSGVPGANKDKLGSIIECLATLPCELSYVFHVLGITEENFAKEFSANASSLRKIRERVVFHGMVSHADSVKFLLSCDYCVFIRDNTRKTNAGFPTKFVECMTAGIGVIANDTSNIRDYFPLPNSTIIRGASGEEVCRALEAAIRAGKIRSRQRSTAFQMENYQERMERFLASVMGEECC